MLEIKPIQSKSIQKALCEKCSISYIEDAFAYSAYDGDCFLGMSQFTIESGYALIKNLASADGVEDFEAMFILGRAVLNFIDLCSVSTAKIEKDASKERLARAIGFKRSEDGEYLPLSLIGMFDAKCPSHK